MRERPKAREFHLFRRALLPLSGERRAFCAERRDSVGYGVADRGDSLAVEYGRMVRSGRAESGAVGGRGQLFLSF